MGGERERGPASTSGSSTYTPASVVSETPAQRAANATAVVAREIAGLEWTLGDLEQATDAVVWAEKRERARQALAEATRSVERARAIATAAQTAELGEQTTQLERVRRRLESVAAPPAYVELSREAEIRGVIDAPSVGGAKAGYDRKEGELAALFSGLDPRESRALVQRLNRKSPEDPIATAIGRWTAERQQRLRAVLAGADRRQAVAAEAARRVGKPVEDEGPIAEMPSAHVDGETRQPADVLRIDPKFVSPPEKQATEGNDAASVAVPKQRTAEYLRINSPKSWDSIRDHLTETSWITAARCTVADREFVNALVGWLRPELPDLQPDKLAPLLYPHDLHAELVTFLPLHDDDGAWKIALRQWVPAVGLRLGQLFQDVLAASTRRMSERYVDAADARAADPHRRGSPVRHEDMITSMPIDRLVARVLTTENVARVEERATPAALAKTKSAALKPVKTPWQGDKNQRLWNWVRADRDDATVEDVAASLFGYARGQFGGDETSFFAYGLAAAPPMFGLPASWAVKFPDAVANAPQSIKDGELPDEAGDSISSRLAVLATSSVGDEIAIKQAAGAPVRDARPGAVLQAVDDVVIQLSSLRETMTDWGLAADLIPAIGHMVDKRRSLESASPADVHAFAAVALGQRDRLVRIAGAVRAALTAATKTSRHRDARNPIRPILARYAEAAASSELQTTSEGLIAQAQSEQQALVIKSLQANELAADQAMDELHAGPAGQTKGAADLGHRHVDTQSRARTLENKLLAGLAVNADDLQRVQLDEQENALNATLFNLSAQLQVIDDEAASADSNLTARIASLGSSKFRSLGGMSQDIRQAINRVRQQLVVETRNPAPRSGDADGLAVEPLDILAKRDALTRAQAEFEKLRVDHDLKSFIPDAYKVIKNQKLRTAIVGAASMIGLSMVGAGLGGLVRTAVGEGLMAAESVATVGELAMGARAQIAVAGAATEIVANSAAQTVMTGESTWKALVENTVFVVGMEATSAKIAADVGLARGFHAELEAQVARLDSIEAKAASQSSKAASVLKAFGHEGVAIAGHTIMGMALGALASRVIETIDKHVNHPGEHQAQAAPGWEDAVIQGASVAIGRLVHAQRAERRAFVDALAHQSGPEGQKLLADSTQLTRLSAELTKSGNAEMALDVLARQREVIAEELRVVEHLLAKPGHGGRSAAELEAFKAELHGQQANARDITMITVQLHLIGLRELEPNTLWSGTAEQIDRAERDIRRTVPDAQVESEIGKRKVVLGERTLYLHESDAKLAPKPAGVEHASTRPPEAEHELSTSVVRVPGAEMRGGAGVTRSPEHNAAILAQAREAMKSAGALAGATHLKEHAGTYLLELGPAEWTSIEIAVTRTDRTDAARLVPNSTRLEQIEGTTVRGEHVLQVSETLALDQVDRVVAHGVARLVSMHQLAITPGGGKYANEGSVLSGDDRGRIAEIKMLAHTAHGGGIDAAAIVKARSELVMLSEYLGIRDGAPGAAERRQAVEAELKDAVDAREELQRAIREPLTTSQRQAAIEDLAAEQAAHQQRQPPHDTPPKMADQPGQRINRAQLAQYASVAARLRHLVSERTIAKYRAAEIAHPGKHPRIEKLQVGAGAALAGRDPSTLLVDARGRWQADGADSLAQAGQQLQELYRARFGDVREVVGPHERVPLDAVNYWEDSLAIQGEVIDGTATYRSEHGKLLVDITPNDGTAMLTLEVGGTIVTATGFPDERFPGGGWEMPASEVTLAVERGLRATGDANPALRNSVEHLLKQLRSIAGARDADLPRIADVLSAAPPDVITALRGTPRAKLALDAISGRVAWEKAAAADAADGRRQMFFGKDANLETIKDIAKQSDDVERTWVFAGAGGVGVSAAEIILRNTQKAQVVMAARSMPDGLFQNGQFRAMAEHYGDVKVVELAAAQGIHVDASHSTHRLRLLIDESLTITTPEVMNQADGTQKIELRKQTKDGPMPILADGGKGAPVTGDFVVSSLGSPGQFPPEIAALAIEARRQDPRPDDKVKAKARAVWVQARFGHDERYLGYDVHIRLDGAYRVFEVTGAASRFAPKVEFERMGASGLEQYALIQAASQVDAHAKSGNFDAGFAATANQTSQHHTKDP